MNNRNRSLDVRFTLGKIYANVGLLFSFGLLPISIIYAFFSHQTFYFSFFTVALLSFNALCIFILKTYIAQSKQDKYFLVTSISHLSNPVSASISVITNLTLHQEILLLITINFLINFFLASHFISKNQVKLSWPQRLQIDERAKYFFLISILLGIFFQWDRLWIASYLSNDYEVAIYGTLAFFYSAISSILSVDYQRLWNELTLKSRVDYSNQARHLLIQGTILSIFFAVFCGFFLTNLGFRLQHIQWNLLYLALAIIGQSFHNLNAAICSTRQMFLRKQVSFISFAVVMRYVSLGLFWYIGLNNLQVVFSSWIGAFFLAQILPTFWLARRVALHA
jgi:hypothetical protein